MKCVICEFVMSDPKKLSVIERRKIYILVCDIIAQHRYIQLSYFEDIISITFLIKENVKVRHQSALFGQKKSSTRQQKKDIFYLPLLCSTKSFF